MNYENIVVETRDRGQRPVRIAVGGAAQDHGRSDPRLPRDQHAPAGELGDLLRGQDER